ncbi:MAG: CapA family protein [Dehalococcoidia bacterium]
MARVGVLGLAVTAMVLVAACAGEGPPPASPLSVAPLPTAAPTPTAGAPSPSAAPPEATPTPSPSVVTLAAVGDVMLGRGVGDLARDQGRRYPLAEVAGVLGRADIAFANLEAPLTDVGRPQVKDFVFRADPASADALAWSGIDVVSLANNHAMDYGGQGLLATIDALDEAGIDHVGAGADGGDAYRPLVVTVRGLRIAFLAYVNVPDDSVSGFSTRGVAAGPSAPGVAWGTAQTIGRDVERARVMADLVVVSLHSGYEYQEMPNDLQVELAHAAVDAGAHLVLGHHPHVLQGLESYGDGLIAYSLGNFVFDLDETDYAQPGLPSALSAVLMVTLGRQGVEGYEVVPVRIDPAEGRPLLAEGEAARPVRERLERLSALLETSEP